MTTDDDPADELPPDTILVERMGPFIGVVHTHHTPDGITVRMELHPDVVADDDASES